MSVRLSFHPLGTTQISLDGFLLNLVLEYFPKICRKDSSIIKPDKNDGYLMWRIVYIYDNIKLISS
jgi:hypothetical protein